MLSLVSVTQCHNGICRIISTLRVQVFRVSLVGYFDNDDGTVENNIGQSALETIKFVSHTCEF